MIGYRIKDAHFKLGSKLHLSEFFYAKRMFQNSFFAHRFAFLIAKYIVEDLLNAENITAIKKNGGNLSIIGYGQYSELLISRVEYLLLKHKARLEITNINHNLICDIDDPYILNDSVPINSNIIVIIPISSTFSTSVKVEEALLRSFEQKSHSGIIEDKHAIGKPHFIHPFISTIVVADGEIESVERQMSFNNNKTDILRTFNWLKLPDSDRKITIRTNFDDSNREQRYFISLASTWFNISSCKLCHNDRLIDEKPIIETDKTSVTPRLIFDNPKFKFLKNKLVVSRIPRLAITSHLYGHTKRDNTHYLHYLEPTNFFKENNDRIKLWLLEIENLFYHSKVSLFSNIRSKRILIISPQHYTNHFFIELVNSVVFGEKATVIHFENKDDAFENFEKFFQIEIKAADLIFFVDDFISGGRNFFEISYFIEHIRGDRGIDGIFVMINRGREQLYQEILHKIKYTEERQATLGNEVHFRLPESRFFSFFDLNAPVYDMNSIDSECPLCAAMDKHDELFKISLTDTIKYIFLRKKNQLTPSSVQILSKGNNQSRMGGTKYDPFIELLLDNRIFDPWNHPQHLNTWTAYCNSKSYPDKYLFKLIVEHELNESFFYKNEVDSDEVDNYIVIREILENRLPESEFSSEFDLLVSCMKKTRLLSDYFRMIDLTSYFTEQLRKTLIKVLTVQPFVDHLKIKNKVFKWVLNDLDMLIGSINKKSKLSLKELRELKFFLRRSVLMKSNYLIQFDTLKRLIPFFRLLSRLKADTRNKSHADRLEIQDIRNSITLRNTVLLEEIEKISYQLNKNKEIVSLDLFNKYMDERKIRKDEIAFNEKKLSYYDDLLAFCSYKLETVEDFDYFLVSLVKELTLKNEAKTIFLEENIRAIEETISNVKENNDDFHYLIRILRLENSSVVEQFWNYSKTIKDQSFNFPRWQYFSTHNSGSQQMLLDFFSAHDVEMDYNIAPLLSYIRKSTGAQGSALFVEHEFKESFLRMLFLRSCMEDELNPAVIEKDKKGLEQKVKIILRNFYRILICEETNEWTDSGAFLAINLRTHKKDKIKPEDVYTFDSVGDDSIQFQDGDMDDFSLGLQMLNGVSGRAGGKAWSIMEITKIDGKWEGTKEEIFESTTYSSTTIALNANFTESIIAERASHFLFFRISVIEESEDGISDFGQGVIVIYNNESLRFHTERVKYLLLLRDVLSRYFRMNSENDSFRSFVEHKRRITIAKNLDHGNSEYQELLNIVSNKQGGRSFARMGQLQHSSLTDMFYEFCRIKPRLLQVFENYKIKNLNGNTDLTIFDLFKPEDFELSAITAEYIKQRVELIARAVFEMNNRAGNDMNVKVFFKSSGATKIFFFKNVFELFCYEILYNAKKHCRNLSMGYPHIHIDIIAEKGALKFAIADNGYASEELSPGKLTLLNRRGYLKLSRGLAMISNILEILGCSKLKYDYVDKIYEHHKKIYNEKNCFQVAFNIKSLEP